MNSLELAKGLKQLHLSAITEDYSLIARQCEKNNDSFEKYLGVLVSRELKRRHEYKVGRLTKAAKLPALKMINEYDFSGREGVTEKQIQRLAEGDFLREAGNVTLYGKFGVGKSHLAMAITLELCRKGYRCYFTTAQALITDLIEAQNLLKLGTLLKKLDRFDLITIDELGYTPQSKEGADLFFQFISQRYERRSLIITTNLPYSQWQEVFINPLMTEAAVDRIIHNCETFNIQGPSWRAQEAKKKNLQRRPKCLDGKNNSE
jgi:DNA replication protein DnaC